MTPYVLRTSQGTKIEEFQELDKAVSKFKEINDNVVLLKQNSGESIFRAEDKSGYCVCIRGKVLDVAPTIDEAVKRILFMDHSC